MTDAREAAGIVVETDVRVRMRDGVHLACDVWRPAAGGPVPALVQRPSYCAPRADSSALWTSSSTKSGWAWPRVIFITCPIRYLDAVSLPPR